ncbi:MAG: D-sedoheptulose-7-phosphate isomerase [Chthoniobacterales bacterium]|jgi:D-sedoheptulose 7-phosphate isomerase
MNLEAYLAEYPRLLASPEIPGLITKLKERIAGARDAGCKLMLAGNGASASIASHLATDFSKQGGVRAMAFNDANLITALGNDCGYENWIAKALDFYADQGDVLILISSSGKSPNVVKAAHHAKELGLYVAAFTGFAKDNPLGAASDINFWVDSRSYNIVECTHMIWLTAAVDLLIGASEYSVSG